MTFDASTDQNVEIADNCPPERGVRRDTTVVSYGGDLFQGGAAGWCDWGGVRAPF